MALSEATNDSSDNNTKFKDGVNRNARLIVRNISFKATEEALRKHFEPFGTVEEVKLLRKPDGKLVGCGFVHYTHVPMANKALNATNKKPFLDRTIQVAWAVPKHKYDEDTDKDVKMPLKNNVSLHETPSVKKEEKSHISKEKEEKNKMRINRNARLIVRNISFKATEETLREHFEPYGTVLEVTLLKKPDGKLVGCAFVHFKNVPMAKKALLNTNMKPFLGRPVSVDWAVAKNKYMQHVVNQQLEMQEKVKKEESDSDDDDGPPLNLSNDELKKEVKSESEEDSEQDEKESDEESADDSDGDDNDDDNADESESDEEDNKQIEDDQMSQASTQPEWKRTKLNDAEDGCTVFITNIPFSIDNDLLKDFAEKTGPVKYALICMDKMTEHSKGTGFVKFVNSEDADRFMVLPSDQLRLDGQVLQVKPALKRENLDRGKKKEPKDNRNLYLVKEGVIVAGTKAAVGVSASDMAKRLALERSKTQMLKNLNRFVSRYRIVVSNLPAQCDDKRLRAICSSAVGRGAVITEARVMRDLRAPLGPHGTHPSKGYGFVMFMRHEDALACLRKLNNNPDIFDKNNRPIVSFSIEDRTALNARKKRLEKSIANNPLVNKDGGDATDNKSRKRKRKAPPDESYAKKGRIERKEPEGATGKYVKRQDENVDEFAGLTAKEGSQHKMRSFHKLKTQADIHKQTVKLEKKKGQRALKMKKAMRERIKLPKQKVNKNATKKKRNKHVNRDRTVF